VLVGRIGEDAGRSSEQWSVRSRKAGAHAITQDGFIGRVGASARW
jgi:hypothetical protein